MNGVTRLKYRCKLVLIACSIMSCGNDISIPEERTENTLLETVETQMIPSYNEENGRSIYQQYCLVCHGDEGDGSGFNAYNLNPKPRDFTDVDYMDARTDNQLVNVIINGGNVSGLSRFMPAWGNTINEREIKYLIKYIRTFSDSSKFQQ